MRADTLPDARHANAFVDQSIPDRGGLGPLHEHLVVGLQQLHLLHGDVVVEEVFHLPASHFTRFWRLKAKIGFHVSLKPHSERHTPHDDYTEQFESCSILIKKFQSKRGEEMKSEKQLKLVSCADETIGEEALSGELT